MTETREDIRYELLVEGFGRELRQAETRLHRRRRRRRRAAIGGLVPAAIVAGALIVTGSGGGGRLDVVAQARAALAPVGRIVHLITTSHLEMRGGSHTELVGPEAEKNTLRVAEQWSTSKPTRWRIASVVPIVSVHGTSSGSVQLSYADGTERLYVQSLNTLDVRSGVNEGAARESLSEGSLGAEPIPRIRALLEAGRLRDAGSGTVDGRVVRRLVGKEGRGVGSTPWPVEYDVDPATYAPVRFTVEEIGTSIPGNAGVPTAVIDVGTYEELPLDRASEALLTISPTTAPTVHRYTSTGAQVRKRLATEPAPRAALLQRKAPRR
jgi:hypothetical protein